MTCSIGYVIQEASASHHWCKRALSTMSVTSVKKVVYQKSKAGGRIQNEAHRSIAVFVQPSIWRQLIA
jgi:hypothetical protein